MTARILLTIFLPRVDENEIHDKHVGFWDVFAVIDHVKIEIMMIVFHFRDTWTSVYFWMLNTAMNDTRADSRDLTKYTLSRDVATIVDYDIIRAGSQQDPDSMNRIMENIFWIKALGTTRVKL